MNHHALAGLLCLAGISCINTTPNGLPKPQYHAKLRQVAIGCDKAEFLKVFPDAIHRASKSYPAGVVEVLAVEFSEHWYVPTYRPGVRRDGNTEYETQWFYFFSGRLVQYGAPNDWPTEPDKILEVRVR